MLKKKFIFKASLLLLFFTFLVSNFLIFNLVSAQTLSEKLAGKFLLQVEDKGKIWYVNPQDYNRYQISLDNALALFRKFAFRISDADFQKIILFNQLNKKKKASDFALKYKGQFLISNNSKAKIFYVDFLGFKHELSQDNLLDFFKNFSLGISNHDLESIPIFSLKKEENKEKLNDDSAESLEKDKYFKSFWELWKLVKEKYVGQDIKESKLFEGAKKGLIEALGDDYSVFMNSQDSQDFLRDLSGKFEGIGVEIAIKNNQLTIVAPLANTPAEKAGLKAGDVVLAIDGHNTQGMNLNQAVSLIKGKSGTVVVLKVRHLNGQEENINIIRGLITYDSLSYEIKDYNIGYIKMIRFNSDASTLFKKAIDYFLEQKVSGIVLDLRNNPGGYMDTAVDLVGYWAGSKIAVIEKFKDKTKVQNHVSQQIPVLKDVPTVVLVNAGSASASEIVAGALQDYKLATIVGEKTFGKGSVQELQVLSDSSYVKLTIAKWYTPLGHSIDKEGIHPDLVIKNTLKDYNQDLDPQLDKALEILRLSTNNN